MATDRENAIREAVARKLRGLPAQPTEAEKSAVCRTPGCTNDCSGVGSFDGFCASCAKRKFKAGDWHTPPLA